MANQTSGNPLILDTAVASWAALGLPGQQCLKCWKIIWLSPTNIGDTFSLKEADGTTIFTGTAEAASGSVGNSQMWTFTKPLNLSFQRGWFLSQITSGTLRLYV